jgi:hypothetical protein
MKSKKKLEIMLDNMDNHINRILETTNCCFDCRYQKVKEYLDSEVKYLPFDTNSDREKFKNDVLTLVKEENSSVLKLG